MGRGKGLYGRGDPFATGKERTRERVAEEEDRVEGGTLFQLVVVPLAGGSQLG